MSEPATIGGVPIDEIEDELVATLEAMRERGQLQHVDVALRLVDRARRAGRTTLPAAEPFRRDGGVTVAERIAVLRACFAAGVDVNQMREDLARGITLPDGRPLRLSGRQIDALVRQLVAADRVDDGRNVVAAAMRTAELARIARIAARAERSNPMVALKAGQMLLERLDEYAPAATPPLMERVDGLLGSEALDLAELEAFYAEAAAHGTEDTQDQDGSDAKEAGDEARHG